MSEEICYDKGSAIEANLRELIEDNGYTFKEVSEETGISLSALFINARGERSNPPYSGCQIRLSWTGRKFTPIRQVSPDRRGKTMVYPGTYAFYDGLSVAKLRLARYGALQGVNAVLLREHQRAVLLIDENLKTYDTSLTSGYARLLAQKAEALLGLGIIDVCVHYAQEISLVSQRCRVKQNNCESTVSICPPATIALEKGIECYRAR